MTVRSALAAAAVAASLALATGASAHGGEDHGAPPAPATGGSERTASATTDQLELVLRWPASEPGAPVRMRVLLSEFWTNAPVEGAAVELSLSGPAEVKATAAATGSPGIYEVPVSFPQAGSYSATITVVAGELVDALALPAVEVGPAAAATATARPASPERGTPWLAIGLGVLALGALLAWLARRSRRAQAVVVLGLLALPAAASAHGGEDHGEAAAAGTATAAAPAAAVALAKESQFLLGIRTEKVVAARVVERLHVSGRIAAPPDGQAPIFAPQPGRLGAPPGGFPRLGSPVRKGQLLGVVEAVLSAGDRASFSAEAAQAGGRIEAASARLEAARRNLVRLQGLSGVVSRAELDAADVEVRSAEAELSAARAASQAYGGKGGATRFTLASPLDGILADIGASPGEIVDPTRRIFLVVDPRELWVEASVYEGDVGRVEVAESALVSVEAYPEKRFRGSLLALGQLVHPETRTITAVFRVENPETKLRVGMFAAVEIAEGGGAQALVVPEAAVLDVEGRRVVYVHTAPEQFTAREVALGRRDGPFYEVREGLSAGDRVVTVGAYSLRSAPPAAR